MSKLLITGGTGSFGKALIQKHLNTNQFDEIRVFSRDEKKQDELRKSINSRKVKFVPHITIARFHCLDSKINILSFLGTYIHQ